MAEPCSSAPPCAPRRPSAGAAGGGRAAGVAPSMCSKGRRRWRWQSLVHRGMGWRSEEKRAAGSAVCRRAPACVGQLRVLRHRLVGDESMFPRGFTHLRRTKAEDEGQRNKPRKMSRDRPACIEVRLKSSCSRRHTEIATQVLCFLNDGAPLSVAYRIMQMTQPLVATSRRCELRTSVRVSCVVDWASRLVG